MWMAGGVWSKMAIKEYVQVKSVQDVVQLISDSSKTSQIISGGVGIALQRKDGFLNCDLLIDISRVEELKTVAKVNINGRFYLHLGATLSLYQTACNEYVKSEFPLLEKVLLECCDPARRNAYTLGGRFATKIPVGMLLPTLCALDATVVVIDHGNMKKVSVLNWLTSEEFEEPFLITAILIPTGQKIVYSLMDVKRRNYPGEILVGVLVTSNETQSSQAENIKIFGSVDKYGVVNLVNVADYLNGKFLTSRLILQAEELTNQYLRNIWGDDEDALYRKRVLSALVSRCLNQMYL